MEKAKFPRCPKLKLGHSRAPLTKKTNSSEGKPLDTAGRHTGVPQTDTQGTENAPETMRRDEEIQLDLEKYTSDMPLSTAGGSTRDHSTSLEHADALNRSISNAALRQRVYEALLPPGYKPKIELPPTQPLTNASLTRPARGTERVSKESVSPNRATRTETQSGAIKGTSSGNKVVNASKSYLGPPKIDSERWRNAPRSSEPEFHLLPNGGLLEANGLGPVLVALALMCMQVAALAIPWVYATHSVEVMADAYGGAGGSGDSVRSTCSWMEMRGWSTFQCTRLSNPIGCREFFKEFNCTTYDWRQALLERGISPAQLGFTYDLAAIFLFCALCTGFALVVLFVIRCTSRDHAGKDWWHVYLVAAGAACLFIALTTFAWSYADAFKQTFSQLHPRSLDGTGFESSSPHECTSGQCVSFWGAARTGGTANRSRWGPAGWYFALIALLLHGPLAYWSLQEGSGASSSWASWRLAQSKNGSETVLGTKEDVYLNYSH